MPLELEPITIKDWPFSLQGIAYGQGTRLQLEVIYSEYDRIPTPTQLRGAWKNRQNGRGVPLLVVVLADNKAHVCGPSGDDPTVYPNLDAGQVERICQEALEQPSSEDGKPASEDGEPTWLEEAGHRVEWRAWGKQTEPNVVECRRPPKPAVDPQRLGALRPHRARPRPQGRQRGDTLPA